MTDHHSSSGESAHDRPHETPRQHDNAPRRPPLQARVKPYEIVSLAGVFSVFAAGVVMLGTRSWQLTVTAFGVAFIVVLVVFATLALTVKPDRAEKQEIERERRAREIDEAIRREAARIEAQADRAEAINDRIEAQQAQYEQTRPHDEMSQKVEQAQNAEQAQSDQNDERI